MAQVDKINEENEQVIYDCLFMSQSEFVLVYGELYKAYVKEELMTIYHKVRDDVIEGKLSYNRKLKKTRLNQSSFGDIRREQSSEKMEREFPKKKSEDDGELEKPKRKGSLKEAIIKLHEEGKTKSEIKNEVGCKYQYVYQTVKKHEEANKVD